MKIAHVITSLSFGGAEKLLVDTLPLYKQKGIDVELIVFNGLMTPFYKKLLESGIKIIPLSHSSNVYNPLLILKLIPILKNYDIIHSHNFTAQYFSVIASLFSNVKLVTTEHSTSNRRRNLKIFRPLDRFIFKRYSCIICISDATKRNLDAYLGTSFYKRTCIIYNGINVSEYENAIPNYGMKLGSSGKIILCMVAGFREQKDQDTIIKSLKYLDKNRFELWLVGDGERRSALESLVESEQSEDCVKFLGTRTDVPSILKTVDIVIMSSHYEGFGLTAVEGMAAGKPVIATNVEGLSQVVSEYGLFFEPGNAKDLAEKISLLSDNKDKYMYYALKAKERAKCFGIDKMVDDYIDVYNRVLM